MNTIARLENKLAILRAQLAVCTDPDEKAELDEKIDFIQDDIDELENEVDPEDVYGILGRADSPALDTSFHY